MLVRPTKGQIDDLIAEVRARAERDERVLVTTLTKKMAEDLTDYLLESGLRVRYLHSEIDTIQRINLLREGLDLPEVSLVAILDADKEGFLRSETPTGSPARCGGRWTRRTGAARSNWRTTPSTASTCKQSANDPQASKCVDWL